MNGQTRKLLKSVEKHGEVSLAVAISLSKGKTGDHKEQYPLALLLENDYLGMTISHEPPRGADRMREYSLATTLHMFGIQPDSDGTVRYMRIESRGSIDPQKERVFIKAKGALYVDEQRARFRERLYSFLVGLFTGLSAAAFGEWIEKFFQ